jgi:soluble lytic murein transglycosylase-like protein
MKTVLCVLAFIPFLLAGCATSPDTQVPAQPAGTDAPSQNALNERIAYYAQAYEVPESLIRRSILRESGYNPTAHNGAFWGLMQIRLDTARGMGYRGSARGLLDADTNLRYAVAYLSNAYVVAGGNPERALALYAGGYFYEARRKGLLGRLRTAQGV